VFADLVLSLPDQTKLGAASSGESAQKTYRATGAKRILIDIGKSFLPKDFDIQPKRGFSMPFNQWLTGPLKDVFRDTLSETTVRRRGWFSVNAVNSVKKNFLEGGSHWSQPWLLMMTELWASQVFDGGGGD
jgi:asparagine synthase (glutamine-hydrolysing)